MGKLEQKKLGGKDYTGNFNNKLEFVGLRIFQIEPTATFNNLQITIYINKLKFTLLAELKALEAFYNMNNRKICSTPKPHITYDIVHDTVQTAFLKKCKRVVPNTCSFRCY
jgi:hypothetical protein